MSNLKLILSLLLLVIFAGIVIASRDSLKQEPEQIITGDSGLFAVTPVDWTNPDKPMPSQVLKQSEIPEQAIELSVTAEGFIPDSFEVEKGQEVVLAVTGADEWSHVLVFESPELSEVAVGIGTGRTRVITFYAPDTPGQYNFYCNVPGHKQRGEIGKMIVR